jgi:hypothetical protein
VDDDIDTTANPSAAPVAGGATTPGSHFGGASMKARAYRLLARLGRRMTGLAYRKLRDLDHAEPAWWSPAGRPSRTAGAPPPSEHEHG